MEIKQVDKKDIGYANFVDVTTMGNIIEIKHMEHKNNTCAVRLIDKDHYMLVETGEVFECNHIENRAENNNSIRVTMRKLRQLINCNVTNIENCRWITITYSENMTDPTKLYKDTEKLIKRVRYKFGHFEYINVAEPQERGAWHLHCIWIFDNKAPYISQEWLTECWGHGDNVKVKKMNENCDDLGSYLTAYLCDVELTDDTSFNTIKHAREIKEVDCEDESGNIIKKRILKGARLHMYPPKFNLYRPSRGIQRPNTIAMPYFRAKEKISSAKLTFESSVVISDGDKFSNTITKEYYNTKRK